MQEACNCCFCTVILEIPPVSVNHRSRIENFPKSMFFKTVYQSKTQMSRSTVAKLAKLITEWKLNLESCENLRFDAPSR